MFYTDQHIQEYLDGRMSTNQETRFEIELGKNRQLREQLDAYRELYAELEDDSAIELPANFTAQVMKKANLATFGSLNFGLWQIFIAMAVVIVAINVSFIYVDMGKLVQDVTARPEFTAPQSQPVQIENQIQPFFERLANIEFNTPIPVLASIILVLLFFIDRYLMKKRKNMNLGKYI